MLVHKRNRHAIQITSYKSSNIYVIHVYRCTSHTVKCKKGNPGKETNFVIGPEMKDNMAVGTITTCTLLARVVLWGGGEGVNYPQPLVVVPKLR